MTATEPAQHTPIPPPVHRVPQCPLCDEDLSWDEYLYCQGCRIHWPDDDGPGRRDKEDEPEAKRLPQCGAEHQPYAQSHYDNIRGHRYRCALDAGHHDRAGKPTRHAGPRVDDGPQDPDEVYRWPVKYGETGWTWERLG